MQLHTVYKFLPQRGTALFNTPAREMVAERDRTVPRSANSAVHQYCPVSLPAALLIRRVDDLTSFDMANFDITKFTSLPSWYHLKVCGGREDWIVHDRDIRTPLATTCDIGWLLKVISKSDCECTPVKEDREDLAM